MNKIDINKQYRTVSGNKVEILKTGVANLYWSVAALITSPTGVQYIETYHDDGRHDDGRVRLDEQPSEDDLVEISPYDDFEIDEPVMVRDYDTEPWYHKNFAGINEQGRAKTWNAGKTSWTIENKDGYSCWNECRRPTPEELAGPVKA